MKFYVSVVLLLTLAPVFAACGDQQTRTSDSASGASSADEARPAPGAPTKEALVGVLRTMLTALEAGDHAGAVAYLSLPEGMSRESGEKAVGTFLKKREISASGIERLSADGQFGLLKEVFAERASGWAERAGVDAESCYALSLEDAEVAAFWNGSTFLIIRLDDVGKLE